MGKTRDLFKKIGDTKGTVHAKRATIKDRNGIDLTGAEDIKRWQEYKEELYKKDPSDPDNHCAFLYFFFFLMALVTASCTMLPTSVHRSSGTLPTRSNALNLFITSSGQS